MSGSISLQSLDTNVIKNVHIIKESSFLTDIILDVVTKN
ncbi:hypothetical protein yfred0001_3630 [Yersinia frederiksenii ATCC 33641]|nr:hypothetical protein yfred0001_3630 [Yersinia frederiksenii ATCC 33641]